MEEIAAQLKQAKEEVTQFKKDHVDIFKRRAELNKVVKDFQEQMTLAMKENNVQNFEFMGMEFDQEFQSRVANAAKISDIANMNFNAKQQVALENARLAQSVDLANLNSRQAAFMAELAQTATLETASLNNRQQAAVVNAQSALQMDLTNLSYTQQTTVLKTQLTAQAILSDTAATNASKQFNATSKNPGTDGFDTRLLKRDKDAEDGSLDDVMFIRKGTFFCHPFRFVKKDWIVAQYFIHNAEDLYNTTRSCEGDINDGKAKEILPNGLDDYKPGMFIPLCGACFWCLERSWAESKLDETITQFDHV